MRVANLNQSVSELGDKITVRNLLKLIPHLGVPHFQRGRVWGRDGISALLESLFCDTPCGSFVLWDSGNNDVHGVPVDRNSATDLAWLIIDGQQRIRSLHDAYANAELDDEEQGAETASGGEPAPIERVWCVNLAKAPGFRDIVKPRGRDFDLFVHTADPRNAKPNSPLRENVLPLVAIRAGESWSDLESFHAFVTFRKDFTDEQGGRLAAERYRELHDVVSQMENREFLLAKRGPSNSLAEMTRLYNRINASGKQVDVEERAFADLVGLQGDSNAIARGLKETFEIIRGRPNVDRDELLEREAERAFGFKLFVRVFLQVCQHHFGYRQGKSTFSFDVIERDDFRQAFAALTADQVDQLWAEARRVLSTLRAILEDELHCDDLRFLPDATSLTPALQLLIQYPALDDERHKPLLALWCLQALLADADPRTRQRWIAAASDSRKLAFEVLPAMMKEAGDRASHQLESALKDANSVQNRNVLLLYWLQRRLRAKDFRYDLTPEPGKKLARPELALGASAKPQKQHLVPFAVAAKIYGPDARRAGSHVVHNIGNLTYISAVQNGLDVLGERFTDLAGELKLEPDNAAAHLLTGSDGNPLDDYVWIAAQSAGRDKREGRASLRSRFDRWTNRRRRIIRLRFGEWIEEIQRKCFETLLVKSWDDVEAQARTRLRIEPGEPFFPLEVRPAGFVRALGLAAQAEDRLMVLLSRTNGRIDSDELHIPLTKRPCVSVRVSSRGVRLRVRVSPGNTRTGLFAALALSDPEVDFVPLTVIPDLMPLLDFCRENHDALMADRVSGKKKRKARKDQFFAKSVEEVGYPRQVVEALTLLGGRRGKPSGDAAVSIRWTASGGGSEEQILRLDLYRGGDSLGLKLSGSLAEEFLDAFPGASTGTSKGKAFCTMSGVDDMLKAAEWLKGRLSR